MNVKEFWNSKELVAIHCDTQSKAKRLLKIFVMQGKKWAKDDISYTHSGWSIWKNEMCYDNKGGFGRICTYQLAKATIVEFDELDEFKTFDIKYGESMPNKITIRAWKTYNLIKRNSIDGKWTSKKEIIKNYPFSPIDNPNGYIARDRSHDVCLGVWQDIDNLNSCPMLDKIIITDGKNNFKMASNKAEALEYLESFRIKAIKSLVRYSNINRKLNADGQGKLLSNTLKPIDDESKARDYIEAFIKEYQ